MLKRISDKFSGNSSSTSLKVYDLLIKKRNVVGKFIGVGLFTENYTPMNIIFSIVVLDIISYIAININSVIVFKDDFVQMIFCLVTLGWCL